MKSSVDLLSEFGSDGKVSAKFLGDITRQTPKQLTTAVSSTKYHRVFTELFIWAKEIVLNSLVKLQLDTELASS